MPTGPCRLCTLTRDLQDSHLMPAGIYTIVRNGPHPEEHPVLITKGASVATSVQARAHMLCAECEKRFDKGGEEWVIENCWHGEGEFPMRTALMTAMPFVEEEGFRAFAAKGVPGVDLEKLVYFAASMFWRGALDGWRMGKGRPTRLMLGLYEEALRRFLLGEAPFPNHVLLVVSLSEAQDNLNNRNMSLPSGGDRSEHGRHYQFVIPGITFLVIVGKAITPEMRQIGTWPNGFVYIATEGDARKLTALVSATKDAPRRGKLLKDLGPRQSG
jgi:hypothetical protein